MQNLEHRYAGRHDIFYSLEVMEPQHPYIWMAAMILSMSLLFSYLIYSDLKEKKQ